MSLTKFQDTRSMPKKKKLYFYVVIMKNRKVKLRNSIYTTNNKNKILRNKFNKRSTRFAH